jgi:hypothetical protein
MIADTKNKVTPIYRRDANSIRLRSAHVTTNTDGRARLLWAVNADGHIFSVDGAARTEARSLPRPWRAVHISVDGAGTVWALATRQGCHALWSLARRTGEWERRMERAGPFRFWGARGGGVWIFEEGLRHWFGVGESRPMVGVQFALQDLSHGTDGTLWALGGQSRFGGFVVRRYDADASTWRLLPPPAAALRISGAADGTAWSVNSRGDIWRLHPQGAGHFGECEMTPECANCHYSPRELQVRDVSSGPDGTLWFLSNQKVEHGFAIGYFTDFRSRSAVLCAGTDGAVSIAGAVITASGQAGGG